MGGDRSLPSFLSHVHSTRKTPWKAIITVGIISSIMLLSNNIGMVAEMTNLAIFLTFISVNAAMIYLRFKAPKMKRPFTVPGTIGKVPVIPVIGILLCFFMIGNLRFLIILGGVILILFGWLFYRWFNLFKHTELRLKVKYHKKIAE
jgi:APA family basic amino acid/polyamine antiporter